MKRNNIASLTEMKARGEKISQVTCYDYSTARIAEAAGVNSILVGDSLGMTMQGYEDTLPVTMEEMIVYGRSVGRACKDTFVVLDMPFMSYQTSVERAVENAGRLMKECRANAVKLEGAVCPQISAITACGIPVCAHIGMTPQSVNSYGGFKVQGRGEREARRVLEDALAVEKAGAFMVVLECVPPKLAALITRKTSMITIGIGAGAGCDGQVLVYQDMLGMSGENVPKFVKRFAEVGKLMKTAFRQYDEEVKSGTFPGEAQTYAKSDCSDEFLAMLDSEYTGRT